MKADLSPLNILYVEDNDDIRGMLIDLMEHESRRIVACADAEEAWLLLQQASFDVLVTDVNLPGWSGTELARRWLQADAQRWVILFSGYEFKEGLASLGANVRSIPKEDFDQLERVLNEISQNRA